MTLILLGAALAATGLAVRRLSEPFDRSLAGAVGADQFGYSCQAYATRGVGARRGAPCTLFLRRDGDVMTPYTHHPVLPYWLCALGYTLSGENIAGLRAVPLLGSLLGITVLALTALRALRGGGDDRTNPREPAVGVPAAALALSSPAFLQYGSMVDSMPLSVAAMVATATLGLARPFRPGLYAIVGFIAGLVGWYAYGVVLALWLAGAGRRENELRGVAGASRRLLRLGTPFAAALLVNLAWLAWARGGLGPMLDEFGFLAGTITGNDLPDRHEAGFDVPWLGSLGSHLRHGLGWGFGIAAGIGLGISSIARLRNRATDLDRAVLALFFAGCLPLVAFWSRAAIHEFFVLLILPAAVIATVRFAVALSFWEPRALRGAVAYAVVAGVVASNFVSAEALRDRYRPDPEVQRKASALDRHFAPNDLVLLHPLDFDAGLRFATAARVTPVLGSPKTFEWFRGEVLSDGGTLDRIFVVASAAALAASPWLGSLPRRPGSEAPLPDFDPSALCAEIDAERLFPGQIRPSHR